MKYKIVPGARCFPAACAAVRSSFGSFCRVSLDDGSVQNFDLPDEPAENVDA
jgi:hypothetical protein